LQSLRGTGLKAPSRRCNSIAQILHLGSAPMRKRMAQRYYCGCARLYSYDETVKKTDGRLVHGGPISRLLSPSTSLLADALRARVAFTLFYSSGLRWKECASPLWQCPFAGPCAWTTEGRL